MPIGILALLVVWVTVCLYYQLGGGFNLEKLADPAQKIVDLFPKQWINPAWIDTNIETNLVNPNESFNMYVLAAVVLFVVALFWATRGSKDEGEESDK